MTGGLSKNSFASSLVVNFVTGPAIFLRKYAAIAAAVRSPEYSKVTPLSKYLIVGYPRTFCSWQISPLAVQSILAIGILSERTLASFSYSGASALQCPHHGA